VASEASDGDLFSGEGHGRLLLQVTSSTVGGTFLFSFCGEVYRKVPTHEESMAAFNGSMAAYANPLRQTAFGDEHY
jgi:hypothetical protein